MGRKTKKKAGLTIEQERSISSLLREFLFDEKLELSFPPSLGSEERAFIHEFCRLKGLKSKSRGSGSYRYITAHKIERKVSVVKTCEFHLHERILDLLQKFYDESFDGEQTCLKSLREAKCQSSKLKDDSIENSDLFRAKPSRVPLSCSNASVLPFRKALPIWSSSTEIMQSITAHQVVLISGETGSGKTTQVPQFILDHHSRAGLPCDVICTQPRRIAAVSLAERVAHERGEKVGQTVGYQIRLERRISANTLLTFCTSGILLRILMSKGSLPPTVTHIIVDELHERNRYSDFLLIILRDLLVRMPNLKLILMSASMNTQLFSNYFGGCPVIEIPGRLFAVKSFFLEDVLKSSGYLTEAMSKFQQKFRKEMEQLKKSCPAVSSELAAADITAKLEATGICDEGDDFSQEKDCLEMDDMDDELAHNVDKVLHDAWITGDDSCFDILLDLVCSEIVPVDYRHREASMTILMVAAGRGNLDAVEQLLDMGANIHLKSLNDWTAIDFAKNLDQKEIQDLLENYGSNDESPDESVEMNEEDKILLYSYQSSIDEERVDNNLIFHMIKHICITGGKGAILVFLPGYDDIVTLRDRILYEERLSLKGHRFVLYTLHSQMQNNDQRNVFNPVASGVRKIILSTNIAETSITVNDVVFVIDSGKLKEKTFDALSGNTQLKATWISQATAVQRRGRAGRCREGICYHLFSRLRFQILEKFQVPEILRVPIEELCLQAKLLSPPDVSIADFLVRAPDPPSFMVIRNAVALLKTIDALDASEALTILGVRLLELSVEPRFGRMILSSIVLGCFDPVLTIVCSLTSRDPFILPSEPSEKKAVLLAKQSFSCKSLSDHLAYLCAFQMWEKSRNGRYEESFCRKNFISKATMKMIYGMKEQILKQLRASGFLRMDKDMKDLNRNSELWPVIRAAVCAGAYPNLCKIDRKKSCLVSKRESKIKIHRSSVLNQLSNVRESTAKRAVKSLPVDWLLYEEMSLAGHLSFIHCCTAVTPITISLFCGTANLIEEKFENDENDKDEEEGGVEKSDDDEENVEVVKSDDERAGKIVTMKFDDWITFTTEYETALLIQQLRQKWQVLFLERMQLPYKPWNDNERSVIDTIVSSLVAEEELLGENALISISRGQYLASDPQKQCHHAQSSCGRARHGNRTFASSKQFDRSALNKEASAQNSKIVPVPSSSSHGVESGSNFPTVLSRSLFRARGTKFFVIKLPDAVASQKAFESNTCAFRPAVAHKLLQASSNGGNEINLIFSERSSTSFQGIARFLPKIARKKERLSQFGDFYYIIWLRRYEVSFEKTRHLKNPWDRHQLVEKSQDGQELQPKIGLYLSDLWNIYG